MAKKKNWTGERLETCITNETMLEHLHRYAIALPLVAGKDVLDIACGEGYGTALLAGKGGNVTGIDIAADVIEEAAKKYKGPGIQFITGLITGIPAAANSFDLITCFETLEHISEHETALTELKRVLRPGGMLIISSPDKANYSDKRSYHNPFHKKELYAGEFKALIRKIFPFVNFYTQGSFSGSFIFQEDKTGLTNISTGDYKTIKEHFIPEPMYHIAFASEKEIEVKASGVFLNTDNLTALLSGREQQLKQTITYRLGHFILAPFKYIRSIFRK